jgi:NAD(P)-dependent dehydrogenase (short-subunit alcohol dehydrogenase family)
VREGKNALVVGGSKGLGAEIVKSLLASDYSVTVISRSKGELEDSDAMKSKRLSFYFVDFSDVDLVRSILKAQKIDFTSFDVVVNNLGGNLDEKDPLAEYNSFERVLWHNFGYIVEVNRACIEGMTRRGHGKICNISSVSALENHGAPQYCASKAALNSYTKAVGRYLASYGITMFGIMPGAILDNNGYWSRMKVSNPKHFMDFRNSRLPAGHFQSATSIAHLVTFIVDEIDSLAFAGAVLLADGGISRTYL